MNKKKFYIALITCCFSSANAETNRQFEPAPKDENGRSYEIHHIDGNHANNDIENLMCISIDEHYQIHYDQGDYGACHLIAKRMTNDPKELSRVISELNKKSIGDKNPFFGKKHSKETRVLISKANQGENHPFYGKKRPEFAKKVGIKQSVGKEFVSAGPAKKKLPEKVAKKK